MTLGWGWASRTVSRRQGADQAVTVRRMRVRRSAPSAMPLCADCVTVNTAAVEAQDELFGRYVLVRVAGEGRVLDRVQDVSLGDPVL